MELRISKFLIQNNVSHQYFSRTGKGGVFVFSIGIFELRLVCDKPKSFILMADKTVVERQCNLDTLPLAINAILNDM